MEKEDDPTLCSYTLQNTYIHVALHNYTTGTALGAHAPSEGSEMAFQLQEFFHLATCSLLSVEENNIGSGSHNYILTVRPKFPQTGAGMSSYGGEAL